jgi:methylamine dehydrogenase accessory protein MauD
LNGTLVAIGGERAKSLLIFFLSPTCPVCKKLLPVLKSASQAEREWLDVVLASDGEATEHLGFYGDAKLQQFPYVLSAELGMTYRVSRLPYAVLIDERGVIRAKGLINSREHLESLFNAKELGVGTVQDYIRERAAAQPGESA